MKKIVLITTGQPSVNPRIVKEADALQHAGFDVTVLFCFFIQWASEKDKELLKYVNWQYKLVGASPIIKRYYYLFTKFRFKLFKIIDRKISNKFLIAERAEARAFDELLYEAKKIKADWYIGHNLGSLSVVVKAAKFNNSKAGFDFEDYHRGEGHDQSTLKRIIFLENKYIPYLQYFSTASTLITAAVQKDHPKFCGGIITLLNCFPLKQQPIFKPKQENDTTLQLFWFSQTIGINRGLELLIKALKFLNDSSIHLTLAGRCSTDMLNYIQIHAGEIFNNIYFAGIIQPEELVAFSSKFDVGLALELPLPFNRDICLTNKVLTYALAGNALILSNTAMQVEFNNLYKLGEIYDSNDEFSLVTKIKVFKNITTLNEQKFKNYNLANTKLNWETEFKKLLKIIKLQTY